MRSLAVLLFIMGLSGATFAAPIIVPVEPSGDGQFGKDRNGFSYGWESSAFEGSANPNWAGHWYESSWAVGSQRTAYLQVALPESLPAAADLGEAKLHLYVTELGGNGTSLYHRTDASLATGLASQKLAGDALVMDLKGPLGLGWLSIDVTEFIHNDLDNGYDWAVFSLPSKSYSSFSFRSGDDTEGFAPYLSVTAVPEPATLSLLALAGLAVRPRRRK